MTHRALGVRHTGMGYPPLVQSCGGAGYGPHCRRPRQRRAVIGATILAAWVAGRMAGINGAGRWCLAWLLIFSLLNLLSLLLYFVAVAYWGAAPP